MFPGGRSDYASTMKEGWLVQDIGQRYARSSAGKWIDDDQLARLFSLDAMICMKCARRIPFCVTPN